MQELPEQRFDAEIARGLKFQTLVTPLQKQSARERLLTLAAEQTMLPPLEVVAERATLRDHAYMFGQTTLRVLQLLITDSSMYERARRPSPLLYEYYNPHGRYAYTIIRMSA